MTTATAANRAQVRVETPQGWMVDVAVTLPSGQAVALDVCSPVHYSSNQPHTVLGPRMLKWVALHARGWRVADVPFWEWRQLRGSQRGAYVWHKLFGGDGEGGGSGGVGV